MKRYLLLFILILSFISCENDKKDQVIKNIELIERFINNGNFNEYKKISHLDNFYNFSNLLKKVKTRNSNEKFLDLSVINVRKNIFGNYKATVKLEYKLLINDVIIKSLNVKESDDKQLITSLLNNILKRGLPSEVKFVFDEDIKLEKIDWGLRYFYIGAILNLLK
ncbi:MAG: hypothetical protein KA885_05840 [Spirochaetes bacterium]|nr:hypothetical protein [Spirochaetota bacterium]